MAGRRRTGALAAGLAPISAGIGLDIKFQQRLIEAGIKTGRLELFSDPSGQQMTRVRPVGQTPMNNLMNQTRELPEGTSIRHTIKTPQGTFTITRQAPKPQKVPAKPFLSEDNAQRFLMGGQPGRPFPRSAAPILNTYGEATKQLTGGVPISPAGFNTLQRAIEVGRVESPASQFLGDRPVPHAMPQDVSPPVRPAIPNTFTDFLKDIQQAKQEGFSRQDVKEQLRALGVDDQSSERLLSQAGF